MQPDGLARRHESPRHCWALQMNVVAFGCEMFSKETGRQALRLKKNNDSTRATKKPLTREN
jgi:hypothetical protein